MDTKAFGRFIGMLNMMNGTTIAVKDALKDEALVALYNKIYSISNKFVDKAKPKSESTRRRSFDKLDSEGKLGEYQNLIYLAIRDAGKISRQDLAEVLNLPINTVTARITELLRLNKIYVSGETFNPKTRRYVECLSVTILRLNV